MGELELPVALSELGIFSIFQACPKTSESDLQQLLVLPLQASDLLRPMPACI